MNVEKSFVEKLQRLSRETRLQELKEEKQKRQRKQQKISNILPLKSRFLEISSPFSTPIYSSSSQRSSPLSKFERVFEAIKKNNKNCKEIVRKYNFKKPKKEIGTSEQVGPIFISDTKEKRKWDDLQQHQERPSQ
jgi:hypothetical protein